MFHHLPMLLLLTALLPTTVLGDPLTPGNLLAVSGQRLIELSPIGTTVQTLTLLGSDEPARDIIVDTASRVQIFHGQSRPLLSTWDADENVWMHSVVEGWSTTDDSQSPGGITALGRDPIAIDRPTPQTGAPRGLLRFSAKDGYQATRFASEQDYIDVTVGHDFHLYALRSDQTSLDRYDRDALDSAESPGPAETLSLPKAARAIAVDSRGRIFVATWDGDLQRLSRAANLEAQLASGTDQLIDLDLALDGRLAAGAKGGKIVLSTGDLSSARVVTLPNADAVFVAFVEEPRQRELVDANFEQGHVGDWSLWVDP